MKSAQNTYRITISHVRDEAKANPPAVWHDEDFECIEIYEMDRCGREMDQLRELIALALDAQSFDGEAGIARIQAVINTLRHAQESH